MNIRPMRDEDFEGVTALWRRAGLEFRPAGRDSREAMRRQMETQGDLMFVAEEGGEIAGVVLGSSDGRKGWINRLAVDPVHQRQGVAKELMGRVEAAMRRRGIAVIAATIFDDNGASMAFFEREGYASLRNLVYFSKRFDPEG